MRKIWYLSTCNTCRRILKDLNNLEDFEKKDISEENISAEELDMLATKVGSYGALFSRYSNKYKEWGLKHKNLKEEDYRQYILGENTMLKRPVIVCDEEVFVGNQKNTVAAAKKYILGI